MDAEDFVQPPPVDDEEEEEEDEEEEEEEARNEGMLDAGVAEHVEKGKERRRATEADIVSSNNSQN